MNSREVRVWPKQGVARAPYWICSDAEIYQAEQRKIFQGPHWHYLGLEAEVALPGNYKTTL
jgi:phenylpropionate dioxygenase-like ring-hydroxylating dioxygenase large terminal subunit